MQAGKVAQNSIFEWQVRTSAIFPSQKLPREEWIGESGTPLVPATPESTSEAFTNHLTFFFPYKKRELDYIRGFTNHF